MKLSVECSWNDKKNKAKLIICYKYVPKSIFLMPVEIIRKAQDLSFNGRQMGPPALKELKEIKEKYPKSLYAAFSYYKLLDFFEYDDEAERLYNEIVKNFPSKVLTECLKANSLIIKQEYEKFKKIFNNIEVLKGVFPNRKMFYFEEALFFHNLWAKYYYDMKNEIQQQKHLAFTQLILNTLQTCNLASV